MTSQLDQAALPPPGAWETTFSARAIAEGRRVGMPRISPDGRWVAFVESLDGRSDLWTVPSDGGQARLVSGDAPCVPGQDNAPFAGGYGSWYCWTPDSSALIYTGSADGQLYHVSRDGRDGRRISDDAGRHLNPQVSRDGAFLVCVVDRGDIDDQVFVSWYDLRGSRDAPRQLTPADVVALDPGVSPDGRRITCVLYSTNDRWAHHSQIATIDLASGDISILTPTQGVVNARPRWSPDGQTIAFLSDLSGYLNVWTMPATGGEPIQCVPEEREQIDLCWSPDGTRLAYLRNEAAEIAVMVLDVESGDVRRLSTEPGVHRELSWSDDLVVVVHHSPVDPSRVIALDPNSGVERSLSGEPTNGLAERGMFVLPEHVSWRSTDGLEVFGLLFTPRRIIPGGHPALISIHGGPTAQSLMTWDPVVQYFVARGWVVLQPNYRGSTGYGRRYADLLHGVWGDLDVQDNAIGVQLLRERGLVDDQRVVAWGGSAGGYATLMSMTTTRGIYAAGVALYGIADWMAMPEDADRYVRYLADSELGPRATSEDLWVRRSPITHAAEASGPLLIFQGTDDRRVPQAQSDAMVEALRRAGKSVEYHVYDGEGHGWRKRATVEDYLGWMESFLAKHVLDR